MTVGQLSMQSWKEGSNTGMDGKGLFEYGKWKR